jgi:signal transduction histidine kinase
VMAASPERNREYSVIEEQAALRRVAVLAARAVPPEQVFTAAAEEIGRLIPDADFALVGRYNADRTVDVVGGWDAAGRRDLPSLRDSPGGADLSSLVFDRNQPVRIDHLPGVSSGIAQAPHEAAVRCWVGAPISVDGWPWGVMIVASTYDGTLPESTEQQLAGFAELVAVAVAAAQARTELRGFAEEQAALRRVAMLVAQGSPPEEVLAAVTDEAGRLLMVDFAVLSRYDADGLATVVGHWVSTDSGRPPTIGLRVKPEGRNIYARVFETGRPAHIDDNGSASADATRDWESSASVGVPIWTEGRLWGVMIVGSRSAPLPAGTEGRLAEFTVLAATAIANAEARAALAASRARLVAAADQTRRGIERDLHDGAQQRLVSLILQLRTAQAAASPAEGELAARLEGAVREASGVLEELRQIARGLHPAILAEAGLRPALRALARRSAVPVELDVRVAGRLPEQIEVSGYYVVAEALTNTAKHARASAVSVEVQVTDDAMRVAVRDDGGGGADLTRGAGLAGLKDRVEALGGRFLLDSPRGVGTTVHVEFPLAPPNAGAVQLRGRTSLLRAGITRFLMISGVHGP